MRRGPSKQAEGACWVHIAVCGACFEWACELCQWRQLETMHDTARRLAHLPGTRALATTTDSIRFLLFSRRLSPHHSSRLQLALPSTAPAVTPLVSFPSH